MWVIQNVTSTFYAAFKKIKSYWSIALYINLFYIHTYIHISRNFFSHLVLSFLVQKNRLFTGINWPQKMKSRPRSQEPINFKWKQRNHFNITNIIQLMRMMRNVKLISWNKKKIRTKIQFPVGRTMCFASVRMYVCVSFVREATCLCDLNKQIALEEFYFIGMKKPQLMN